MVDKKVDIFNSNHYQHTLNLTIEGFFRKDGIRERHE
jgi:hypothetical protein